MGKLSKIGICVISAALLSACNPDPTKMQIIARIGSPDGARDAVYAVDMSGGATVGPSQDVYVVAKGRFPRLQDRVFSQERVCNLKVRWLNSEAIQVGYSGQTAKFEGVNSAGPVLVDVKWLGRDVTNGC